MIDFICLNGRKSNSEGLGVREQGMLGLKQIVILVK